MPSSFIVTQSPLSIHVLGNLGMRCVHVVEQRRSEERGELHGQEDGTQKRPNREF